ncbi:PAP-specific phosphatase HAL2-like isoform X1 [Juglans microcarpa x Juglans regia]|uniref:PAP-specific phosphatase HAL2-like isoform X1 n=1 Tax=Juglans microcarpa x Juglans regia TaxID=2249226 RepID=UPI001B7F43FF|nr:PAP-specific phosphatase HAL2-like isoform X1 [Juglans microcarpa x Juglans regia]
MPIYCWRLATGVPYVPGNGRVIHKFTSNHVGSVLFFHHQNSAKHIFSVPKFNQSYSSSIIEEQKNLGDASAEPEKFYKELDVAVRAVQMACSLCQRVQDSLISKSKDQVHSKDDSSPVTIADWIVQAAISWLLSESFGRKNVSIVAEEDVKKLSKADASGLLAAVVNTVNECLAEAPRFGFQGPDMALGTSDVLEAISHCNSSGGPTGRFWTLDPVDGTLGFVRGDQYAIALALIKDGEVVLGVLGCPNYPTRKEWLSYHHRFHRIKTKLTPPTSDSWHQGLVTYALKHSGRAWMQPLLHANKKFVWPNSARPVCVCSIDDPALATFCEPVEKANSSHSFTAGLAHTMGLRAYSFISFSLRNLCFLGLIISFFSLHCTHLSLTHASVEQLKISKLSLL